MHISKGQPRANTTKVWLIKAGGCIVANNNSKILEKDLRELLEVISNNYFYNILSGKFNHITEMLQFNIILGFL